MNPSNNKDDEKRTLLNDLINVTREISSKCSGGKQMVTEERPEVEKLLNLLEKVLCFGLKNNSRLPILDNIQELFSSSSSNNGSVFWSFAYQHLTKHEQERFSSYKNLWTDRGKTKALIRNALNERCLERYLLTWLAAENLNEFYENFSMLRDEKAAAILPKLAADLSPILFAISIDVPELNVASSKSPTSKTEPIIAVPNSSSIIKTSTGKHRRNIDEFEETVKANEMPSPSTFTFEASPSYEAAVENILPTFSDKISIISSESSPSSFNLKDDDTISHSSSTSSDDEFSTPKTSSGEPEASINTLNQIDNEVMMQKQRERIMELENQVLELTLENSRLKKLLNSSKVNTLANLQISIPRAVLQKTKTKNFYLYEINLRSKDGSESWTIFKRYRDFHTLHKQLRKQHLQIKILDFPPKKKLGNLDFDFVEERRQRLQVYMRHVLQNVPELANCDSRKFLEAKCSFFKS